MSEDTTGPQRGRARTNTSSNRSNKMGSQTSRARKTRVQAAPLRESRIEAQEMQEVEPVAQAADEPAQSESDDTEPIDPPVVLRPIRKQYTPLSVSHQLNLPAWS